MLNVGGDLPGDKLWTIVSGWWGSVFLTQMLMMLLSLTLCTSPCLARPDNKSRFDLPAEPLGKALRDFAVQAKCNISYEPGPATRPSNLEPLKFRARASKVPVLNVLPGHAAHSSASLNIFSEKRPLIE
jgi:hypothetical protein